MDDYQQLIKTMSPELYERLKNAVETGRWPDGRAVTREQRENALQAVIAWGEQNLDKAERVGFIDKGHKDGDVCDDPEETPLNWKN